MNKLNDITYLDHQLTYNYFNKKGEVYRLNIDSRMGMYLNAYDWTYFQQPPNIDFLIHAFDRDEQIDFVRSMYSEPLSILERYKDKLKIYTTDYTTIIFYKKIKPSRIVGLSARFVGVVEKIERYEVRGDVSWESGMYSYFDMEGYAVRTELLTKKYAKELISIHKKYAQLGFKTDAEGKRAKRILEYIPTRPALYNAISKELIPTNSSAFYQEIIEWMEKTCKENSYSRFIVPSLIPIEKSE